MSLKHGPCCIYKISPLPELELLLFLLIIIEIIWEVNKTDNHHKVAS